jgi:hypothetical protein
MMAVSHDILLQEIRLIIVEHIEELKQYIPAELQVEGTIPENVVLCLRRLSEIQAFPPDSASYELYAEACECRQKLRDFLQRMNQSIDGDFAQTHIGQICVQTDLWCQAAAAHFQPKLQDVWDFIAPVRPDMLMELDGGNYEARWWKPVPMMDIEILKRTEGVVIQGEPFEPTTLPGGLAFRFSLSVQL